MQSHIVHLALSDGCDLRCNDNELFLQLFSSVKGLRPTATSWDTRVCHITMLSPRSCSLCSPGFITDMNRDLNQSQFGEKRLALQNNHCQA